MRVICISDKHEWDAFEDGPQVEKGKIYTVIDVVEGYGRFRWWPFTTACYTLIGFPDDLCFPVWAFIEIIEDDIDEMELVNEKHQLRNFSI